MKQAKAMTDEELRIKVSELCGWTELDTESEYIGFSGKPPKSYGDYDSLELPNYTTDLNAMHEAVMALDETMRLKFCMVLMDIVGGGASFNEINATARQRAEAFVLTMEDV